MRTIHKILTFVMLSLPMTTAFAQYAEHSVLADGTWRKVYVTEDGMYRLTPSTLKSMGFSDPTKVHVYGYGGHQLATVLSYLEDLDDLKEIPLYDASDGSLLFWANGLVGWSGTSRTFNAYATKAAYFLTESDVAHTVIPTEVSYTGESRDTISTRLAHQLYEKDNFAWFQAGRDLVDGSKYTGETYKTYNFKNVNSLENEKLTVVFTSSGVACPLTVYVNDQKVGSTETLPAPSGYNKYSQLVKSNMSISACDEETGNWKIQLSTGGGGSEVEACLDYLAMNYTAPIMPENGYVQFGGGYMGTGTGTGSQPSVTETYSGTVCFSISDEENASASNLKVMRQSAYSQPVSLVPTTEGQDGLNFTTNQSTDNFVAFDPSYAFPEPEDGGSVANQDLHALDSIDMVIIVPVSGIYTKEAQRLAQAHLQYQGLKCAVVTADKIYNEFSSGTPDATAYRRLMKMLYDRGKADNTQPKWLLLFGDCMWDNRMKSSDCSRLSQNDYLLCYESENSYSDTQAYCWEDYFALMDGKQGATPASDTPDIAVGRFPATSVSEATIMVDKTIQQMSHVAIDEWANHIVFIGDDDGTSNDQMENADKVANLLLDGNLGGKHTPLNIQKIMLDSYERENTGAGYRYPTVENLIRENSEGGTLLFNFTGHGAAYSLTHEQVVTLSSFKTWVYGTLPVWFTAACDTQPFDQQTENLGEVALRQENGGAVAFIGTTHTVYSNQNYNLNRLFTPLAFSTDNTGRRYSIGEALYIAKDRMYSSGGDGGEYQNKFQYCLMGDPAIVIGNPLNKVSLDSINGEALTGSQQMKAGARMHLAGHLSNVLGDSLTAFHGRVAYRLYDSIDTLTTRGNSGNDPYQYRMWNTLITNGTAVVENGRFTLDFVMPRDIKYTNLNGRIEFFAASENDSITANGCSQDFLVGGTSEEMAKDSIGPDMTLYINGAEAVDGMTVGQLSAFTAQLYDEAGIQHNGNGIGHDLMLTIDNDPSLTYNLNEYYEADETAYTHGTVYYTLPELSEGHHSLIFRAWDMLNNTSADTLEFIVGEDLQPHMTMAIRQEQTTGLPTFCINYNYPGLTCRFNIYIASVSGQRVYSQDFDATGDSTGYVELPWNGYNGAGGKANDGIYAVRVTVDYNGKTDKCQKKFMLWGNN